MLKRKHSKVYLITNYQTGDFITVIQCKGVEEDKIKEELKVQFPNNYKQLSAQLITDDELFATFKTDQNRKHEEGILDFYTHLIKTTTNPIVGEEYDTTKLLDDLENKTYSELQEVVSTLTINLLTLHRNMFLTGSFNNPIWRTAGGILSDYAEDIQRGAVLMCEGVTNEVKKPFIYDLVAYFEVLNRLYCVTRQHSLYNDNFLNLVIDTKHYLEKIELVSSDRPNKISQ